MNRKVCAFTGHRPQKFPWRKDETSPACAALKEALNTQILRLVEAGFTDFLSGMALGVDQWAAASVLELRENNPVIKLHCILPCKAQADGWTALERDAYRTTLNEADSVVYVNREKIRDCMLVRNRFMIEHASLVLAVYNGEKRGGTASTVRYARKLGRDVWILHPTTLRITHEQDGDNPL